MVISGALLELGELGARIGFWALKASLVSLIASVMLSVQWILRARDVAAKESVRD